MNRIDVQKEPLRSPLLGNTKIDLLWIKELEFQLMQLSEAGLLDAVRKSIANL